MPTNVKKPSAKGSGSKQSRPQTSAEEFKVYSREDVVQEKKPVAKASKVVEEIEKIRIQREARRAKQKQQIQQKNAALPKEQERDELQEYRRAVKEFKGGIAKSSPPVDENKNKDVRIMVCVRKRPMSTKGSCELLCEADSLYQRRTQSILI
jgi:uncharacterized protein YaaR (DUF327 family)